MPSRTPSRTPSPGQHRSIREVLRLVVTVLVGLQGLVLAGFAIAWLATLVRGEAELPGAVLFLSVGALFVAAVLALCARGVHRRASWSRAPIVTWELLLGVMAVGWLSSDGVAWGVLGLLSAVVIVAALLVPRVVDVRVPRLLQD